MILFFFFCARAETVKNGQSPDRTCMDWHHITEIQYPDGIRSTSVVTKALIRITLYALSLSVDIHSFIIRH